MSDVLERAAQAHQAVKDAEALHKSLLAERSRLIQQAKEEGIPYRQVAKMIGLSPQRVQRAANGNRPKKARDTWVVPVDL